MKQKYVLLPLLSMLLFLTLCKETMPSEATKSTTDMIYETSRIDEHTEFSNITTYPPATVPTITTSATKETETTSTYIPEIPTVYDDTFESFMQINSGLTTYDMYTFNFTTLIPETHWSDLPALAFFRVLDVEGYVGEYTIYHIQFVDAYGWGEYNTEIIYGKIYRMAWLGLPGKQLYGRPPLEIGGLYARIITSANDSLIKTDLLQAGLVYKVTEEGGKRYIYGYGMDLSEMECKIPITNTEENCPYEKGKHDKAIAYLESIGVPLPSFDYKCETDAFYAELEMRCP